MYAKLFTSIYQGTLRGNSHGLLVFTNLLAHADRDGYADIHPRAIAEEVGLTIDQVKAALLVLESPDDESRSPEEQGRRIVRMDEHRAWGWQVVNYVKYRSIRDADDRREQNRVSQANWRAKRSDNNQSKPASSERKPRKPRKPESAHTEAEAEAEELKSSNEDSSPEPATPPASDLFADDAEDRKTQKCPVQRIVESYHRQLPALAPVRELPEQTVKMIRARWRGSPERQSIAWWDKFFAYVGKCPFLVGERTDFQADLLWLARPTNFAKVINGNYEERSA